MELPEIGCSWRELEFLGAHHKCAGSPAVGGRDRAEEARYGGRRGHGCRGERCRGGRAGGRSGDTTDRCFRPPKTHHSGGRSRRHQDSICFPRIPGSALISSSAFRSISMFQHRSLSFESQNLIFTIKSLQSGKNTLKSFILFSSPRRLPPCAPCSNTNITAAIQQ